MLQLTLREKCPNVKLFLGRTQEKYRNIQENRKIGKYGKIRIQEIQEITNTRIQENTDQK